MTTQGHGFSLEFDIPYRDLGWHGVPHREMVFIQPTVNCLVNLTEMPFFIVEVRVFLLLFSSCIAALRVNQTKRRTRAKHTSNLTRRGRSSRSRGCACSCLWLFQNKNRRNRRTENTHARTRTHTQKTKQNKKHSKHTRAHQTLTGLTRFLVEIVAIEHVHLERCTSDRKNFDMIILLKNRRKGEAAPYEAMPSKIDGVPMNQLDTIQARRCGALRVWVGGVRGSLLLLRRRASGSQHKGARGRRRRCRRC